MDTLRALVARHCHDGVTPTAIPQLILSRACEMAHLSAGIYYPLLCVVTQGRKRLFLDGQAFDYDPATYLITSVDLPVTGQLLETPCAGLTLALDTELLSELLFELDGAAGQPLPPVRALTVNALEDDLLDPLVRLLRLLDRPREIPVLAPLIQREIHYRLLLSPQGETLRQLARPTSQVSQISRVIHAIRRRYNEPLRAAELSRIAGMSVPSFHRHFRAVTSMSPLQFQKQIRLQEARRILHSRKIDAVRVSFDVGYESASQFSREYRRLFGAPPRRDAAIHSTHPRTPER